MYLLPLSALTYDIFAKGKKLTRKRQCRVNFLLSPTVWRQERCCMRLGKSCTVYIWHQVNARLQRLNREIMIAARHSSDKTVTVWHIVMVVTRISLESRSARYDDPEKFFAHFSCLCQIWLSLQPQHGPLTSNILDSGYILTSWTGAEGGQK